MTLAIEIAQQVINRRVINALTAACI
jgi:hypothetical protein